MTIKIGGVIWNFYTFEKGGWERRELEEVGTLNLCNVFWNLLFKTVALIFVTWFVCAMGVLIYSDLKSFLIALGILGGSLAVVLGTLAGGTALTRSELIQTIKGNYCPQIKLRH